ncbi:MAG: hypothetical protein H0W87_05865 [Actinobacteria bacterium]|nr:hypothetical protein [Actinomycetota bacterium]
MQVALRLHEARELFEQPERSPLDPDYEPWCVLPGAEYLIQVIRSDPRARIAVEVPRGGPGPGEVRAALVRYSGARAAELTREIRSEVRRALWTLLPTGIVFAVTLVLSRLADSSSSHWLSSTIAEALVVVGWVVLWAPIAILGTDIWILVGRRQGYRRLASHEVEVTVV